jgi:hypothetical protein
VLGTLLALWIGWHVSVKHWFTGPKHPIDLPEGLVSRRADAWATHEGCLTGEHRRTEGEGVPSVT